MALIDDRISEAEQALHDLNIGKQIVEVRDSNGESVKYNSASRGQLAAYLSELRRARDSSDVTPMRVFF